MWRRAWVGCTLQGMSERGELETNEASEPAEEIWRVRIAPDDIRVMTFDQLEAAFFSGIVNADTSVLDGDSTDIISHDTLSTCGPSNGGTNCSDGSKPGYYVTITGTLSYSPVMPYSILADPTALSAQAVVRIQ